MQVVGIVHYAFNIALIIAYFHSCLKDVFFHLSLLFYIVKIGVSSLFTSLVLFPSFQILIAKATPEAVFLVAILVLELDKGL